MFILFYVGSADAQIDRYRATFLYKIISYVEWPNKKAKRKIGFLGNSRTLIEFQAILKSRGGTNIVVQKISQANDIQNCDLVYIPTAQNRNFSMILSLTKGRSVMVISETPELVKKGAGIGFYIKGQKLKFIINQSVVEKKSIKISGTLLQLADVI